MIHVKKKKTWYYHGTVNKNKVLQGSSTNIWYYHGKCPKKSWYNYGTCKKQKQKKQGFNMVPCTKCKVLPG